MVKKEYLSPQILATFCLWVLFIDAKKHYVSEFKKIMEFSLRVGDMSFFVFCKFKIVISKIVEVMTENIPFDGM